MPNNDPYIVKIDLSYTTRYDPVDGLIIQFENDIGEQINDKITVIMDVCKQQVDQKFRDGLIALGWSPPPDDWKGETHENR